MQRLLDSRWGLNAYHLNWVSVMFLFAKFVFCSDSCCSVAKSCLTLCNCMNCSMPGFPVLQYLPEFAQIHVRWVGNTILPTHLLLPSSFAFTLSQHQGLPVSWLFASGGQIIGTLASVSVLSMNIWGWFPLGWTVLVSLQSRGLSRGFFSATVLYYI